MAERPPRAEEVPLPTTTSFKRTFDALGLDQGHSDPPRAGGSGNSAASQNNGGQVVEESNERCKRARSGSGSSPVDLAQFSGPSRMSEQRATGTIHENRDSFRLGSTTDILRPLPGTLQPDLPVADALTDDVVVQFDPSPEFMDVDEDIPLIPEHPTPDTMLQASPLSPRLRTELERVAAFQSNISALRDIPLPSPPLSSSRQPSEGPGSSMLPPQPAITPAPLPTMERTYDDEWAFLLAQSRRSALPNLDVSTSSYREEAMRQYPASVNPAPSRSTRLGVHNIPLSPEELPPAEDRLATSMREAANGRGPRSTRPSLHALFEDDPPSRLASRRLPEPSRKRRAGFLAKVSHCA
ncbi:hypothetical protein OBBRIDRAFT_833439 [Obba rivulosa]|uniref:Uncharacterized protein n=1 Tax=Obba rivulosa TaxID=1052685 RepID=A0A8E2AWV4_9APHY|nr:hypothetical protein OBBRIDRAFT_833439 [Obba rivulosa]